MRQFRPSQVKAPPTAHPLVKRLFAEMELQQVGVADLAERAGVARETLSAWRHRQSPSLVNMEACLNVLGLRLRIGYEKPE